MNPTFVPDEVVTAAKMNQLPKGVLGRATNTAAQGTITTEVDVTGATVTVTVPAGRVLRVAVNQILTISSAAAGTTVIAKVKEGTTEIGQYHRSRGPTGTVVLGFTQPVFVTPSAGTHTYKLSMEVAGGGSGAIGIGAVTMVVEDIGGTA